MDGEIVTETNLEEYPLFRRGKVRDVYDLSDRLLIVATDRISAFDCVLNQGIPGKGKVLNAMAAFWFRLTGELAENHMISTDASDLPDGLAVRHPEIADRFMLVKKVEPLPVECVVRGYLAGSAWKMYRSAGAVQGHALPEGLRESDRLPSPIFTPTTKAETGHDEPMEPGVLEKTVGEDTASALARKSLDLYEMAFDYAKARGILIADTKLEWGVFNGELILIDEAFTPDSSRFWPADGWAPGQSQPSFDKQFVRDWLESSGWDKTPPPPDLPDEVVQKTAEKYAEARKRITGTG